MVGLTVFLWSLAGALYIGYAEAVCVSSAVEPETEAEGPCLAGSGLDAEMACISSVSLSSVPLSRLAAVDQLAFRVPASYYPSRRFAHRLAVLGVP